MARVHDRVQAHPRQQRVHERAVQLVVHDLTVALEVHGADRLIEAVHLSSRHTITRHERQASQAADGGDNQGKAVWQAGSEPGGDSKGRLHVRHEVHDVVLGHRGGAELGCLRTSSPKRFRC